jgi:glycosyltransferase involved in cell wall biosynthesis
VVDREPRVLLDATAVPGNRAGVGRYVDSLVPELAATDIDLHLVCQSTDAAYYAALAPDSTIIAGSPAIARRPARLAWEQAVLPRIAQHIGADVLHCPHYTMPLRVRCPVVVTIHDATFFSQPDTHTKIKAPFFRTATRRALRSAVRCVVPSRATRDDLVQLIGADPARMSIAYHGVDPSTFHVPDEEEKQRVRSSLGLGDRPYVAFLSTLQPRKNAANLVRGWAAAVADRADPPILVLAGGKGWDDTIDDAIAGIPAHLRVLRPGHLPIEDLSGFLGGATAVAYPTYGEGFGLPVLEGMACGTPVLTTRRLSIPEVGGDAVAYCETDAASIAAGLRNLLDDEPLRRRLARAGRKRSTEFTWQASAQSHLAAYREGLG